METPVRKARRMKYVLGGIGDFLQVIDSAREEGEINVYSHQGRKVADDFFQDIGIKPHTRTFSDGEDLHSYPELGSGQKLARRAYPMFTLPDHSWRLLRDYKKGTGLTVGIHPTGSAYSNSYWVGRGMPGKDLPVDFVKKIVDRFVNARFLVFGTEAETTLLHGYPGVDLVSFPNIWDSLAHVTLCDVFIGVDSAFKSMSAISRIPTIVFVGDYPDCLRDEYFITPYREDGVLFPISFSSLSEKHLDEMSDILQNMLFRDFLR